MSKVQPERDYHDVSKVGEVLKQLRQRDKLEAMLRVIAKGFTEDPGTSDLDDEQPIHVSMTLGDYRRAIRLLHEVQS